MYKGATAVRHQHGPQKLIPTPVLFSCHVSFSMFFSSIARQAETKVKTSPALDAEAGGNAVRALVGRVKLADGLGGAVTSVHPLAAGVADLPAGLGLAGVCAGLASLGSRAAGCRSGDGDEGGEDDGEDLHVCGCWFGVLGKDELGVEKMKRCFDCWRGVIEMDEMMLWSECGC